jgi:hypothetical protein
VIVLFRGAGFLADGLLLRTGEAHAKAPAGRGAAPLDASPGADAEIGSRQQRTVGDDGHAGAEGQRLAQSEAQARIGGIDNLGLNKALDTSGVEEADAHLERLGARSAALAAPLRMGFRSHSYSYRKRIPGGAANLPTGKRETA